MPCLMCLSLVERVPRASQFRSRRHASTLAIALLLCISLERADLNVLYSRDSLPLDGLSQLRCQISDASRSRDMKTKPVSIADSGTHSEIFMA